jgi:hypothetical protein
MSKVPSNIIDKRLYIKIKNQAKIKFDRFPSAYASMWIAKTYKKQGGRYTTKKNKSNTGRWLNEKWIQIVPYFEDNKIIACGEDNKDAKACRPLKRVDEDTPKTIKEIKNEYGKDKVLQLAKKKNKDMKGRLNWEKGTFKNSQ